MDAAFDFDQARKRENVEVGWLEMSLTWKMLEEFWFKTLITFEGL